MTATGQPTSPLTGRPARPGPVLAVKVDNARDARPHVGIEHADVVFVEQVEGGLSRLMAVYASQVPGTIGPVRSAREHQLTQLGMFRRPALAYSGAHPEVEDLLRASPLFARPHERFPDFYGRDKDRPAPHNLMVTPDLVARSAPDASYAVDIGWRHGSAPEGGEPTAEWEVEYPSARVGFVWSADEGRWLASFDGEAAMNDDGRVQLGPATVVVQRVRMPASEYRDSAGKATPYVETVGEGDAVVLRDGRRWSARWERPCAGAGTEFRVRSGGERARFARGQVWIVYEKTE